MVVLMQGAIIVTRPILSCSATQFKVVVLSRRMCRPALDHPMPALDQCFHDLATKNESPFHPFNQNAISRLSSGLWPVSLQNDGPSLLNVQRITAESREKQRLQTTLRGSAEEKLRGCH